jgi:hypothetical protein
MKLIDATTIADGWLQACEHIQTTRDWRDFTVVVHCSTPSTIRRADRAVERVLDAYLAERRHHSNHTVAETIFPGYEYRHHGVDGVFTTYPEKLYPMIKRHPDMRKWGTYAYRLLRRRTPDGTVYNPLSECIRKMKDATPKAAAYEIGLGHDLATYDDDTDRGIRFGGPCLSHLSFKIMPGRVLQLTALYRKHWYVQRAFGNLLGLARLQHFVAKEAGLEIGPLACHSTMAELDFAPSGGRRKIAALVATCRAVRATPTQTRQPPA